MGGSGGGSSGRVAYPDYMEAVHEDWLRASADVIETSVTEIMDSALGSSPFSGLSAFDPATPLADAWTAVCAFNTAIDALTNISDFDTAQAQAVTSWDTNVLDDAYINDDIVAYAQQLEDIVNYIDLPKLRAGYRDVNAVMSSAFSIAEGVLLGMKNKELAKYATSLRLTMNTQRNQAIDKGTEVMMNALLERVRLEGQHAHIAAEHKRIHIVAESEQDREDKDIAERDSRWDLGVFQYGAAVMASVSGGAVLPDKPSAFQSVLGGAMSGAAVGAAAGLPGMGIGAALGGLAGLFM
jgi:hypothetical protein